MARRKRQYLDDGDDSDSVSGSENGFDVPGGSKDERDEYERFADPYGNKKRRVGGKDRATYGAFGDDSEDEGFGGRKKQPEKRSDWTKAPSFVSGDKVDLQKTVEGGGEDAVEIEDEESSESDDNEDEDEGPEGEEERMDTSEADDTGPSKAPSPRVREEEEEERPRLGGLGLGKKTYTPEHQEAFATPSFSRGGIGSNKGGIGSNRGGIGSSTGGIGFSKGGIGSSTGGGIGFSKGGIGADKGGIGSAPSHQTFDETSPAAESLPTAFGAAPRPQRAFVRNDDGDSTPSSRKATPLPTSERVHFSKLSGTFGARMLEKMGWQAGAGLGVEGEGIITPIESKLRPKGAGIAFGGFKERTDQSKFEARRRGEAVSDDEEKPKKSAKGKSKGVSSAKDDAWKRPKKVKVKIQHKTYEEIIADAGGEPAAVGIGQIIDATGATLREVSSLADVSVSSWTPSTDSMRIPEVRHNIRLIAESCKTELDGLAREGKAVEDRQKWIRGEDMRLRRKVESEAELIQRLQGIHLVVDDINGKAKEIAVSDYEPSLEIFSGPVEKLLSMFPKEFERYRLDEVVVGAISPILRRLVSSWKPLQDPNAFTASLRRWKNALKMRAPEAATGNAVSLYGGAAVVASTTVVPDNPMTPYESLIWNVWLPRIRSCINNEWIPQTPNPAVQLFEAWSEIIPPFVRDNVLDQLILPKVSAAISSWNPKKHDISLQAIVFPWLPHVGLRMEDFVGDARRKIRNSLRSWSTNEGVPKDLLAWRDVFPSGDWEAMLLKYVLPKLGATLRDDFRVYPPQQDMVPIQDVIQWSGILRASVMGQLLELEFFPKWLDVLYVWLIQPKASFEEIAQWYSFWKGTFPESVQTIPAVSQGFTRGLQLMNDAIELGADAQTKLRRPDYKKDGASPLTVEPVTAKPRARAARVQEITFKSIVEEYTNSHNLFFMPAGKVHEKSRLPLYRVSKSVDGRGGVMVYLLDDAVWAGDGDDYRAITLENMVLQATKA